MHPQALPRCALLHRYRGAIDEPITFITLITLTITLITFTTTLIPFREEGVRWDRDADDNTELAPVWFALTGRYLNHETVEAIGRLHGTL